MGNVAGIRTGASQISLDFLVKIRHVQRNKGRIVLATATPIANSLAEAYVFATYLQHDQLEEQGIDSPDAFFGNFTRTYSSVELEPSCSGYRVVSKLEFGNIPELVHMLRQSWHVVPPEDLGLQLPQIATGQEIVVQTAGSQDLQAYIADIAARVKAIRAGEVAPTVDNMLKVCSDGRWASLVNGPPNGEIRDTKLDRVVETVLRHWHETAEERGAQIVFCDLGTPTGERTAAPEEGDDVQEVLTPEGVVAQARVYEYIRHRLVTAGIPREQVIFLQDQQGDPIKLREVYRRVNAGDVRVLLGSAPTGMNIQERLVALHHVDPVWRPDWKTQRDGRIVRQGNRFGTVYIYVYLTEGSFDAYMWGLIKGKLRVIDQVTHGDPTIRKIDGDVGAVVLRASEIQAIASGNPRVLEFVGVQGEMTKLSALRNEFDRLRRKMEFRRVWIPREVSENREKIARHSAALDVWQRRPTEKGSFHVQIGGVRYATRKEAGDALLGRIHLAKDLTVAVGEYCGFTLMLQVVGKRVEVLLRMPVPESMVYDVSLSSAVGVWAAIEYAMDGIAGKIARLERECKDKKRDLEAIERELPVPWDRAQEYARSYARYHTLAEDLASTGVSIGEFLPPDAAWVEEIKREHATAQARSAPALICGVQLRLFGGESVSK